MFCIEWITRYRRLCFQTLYFPCAFVYYYYYNVERDSAFLTSPDYYYRSGRVVECCSVVRLSAVCVSTCRLRRVLKRNGCSRWRNTNNARMYMRVLFASASSWSRHTCVHYNIIILFESYEIDTPLTYNIILCNKCTNISHRGRQVLSFGFLSTNDYSPAEQWRMREIWPGRMMMILCAVYLITIF